MQFTSDNASPVAPEILAALHCANDGHAMPYGNDPLTEQVRDRIRAIFEAPEAAVYLVGTGTAANALALAISCPPWASVYCHRNAHIEEDECGAPEFFTGGAKLVLIEGEDAKMSPDALARAVRFTARAGVHNVQRGMLSLTNVTENGTVYTVDQIKALTAIARAQGLPCHLDGARFANALAALACTPAEMTWKAGIDILSLGGTKNGCMGVEAVVIFDPAKAWEFELRRKRAGHLFSKHRYLAAQMLAYLSDDLWLRLAGQANAMAARLAEGVRSTPDAALLHPAEANMVFARWPRGGHKRLRAAGAGYYFWPFDQALDGPDDDLLSARLVCSWSTSPAQIDGLVSLLRG